MNSAVIETHLKNCYAKVFSGREFDLKDLEESFLAMAPILGKNSWDYARRRLPAEIENHPKIYLVSTKNQLNKIDVRVNNWRRVKTESRRRFSYYNQVLNCLAFQISSDADIDDLINNFLALGKNFKIHYLKDDHFDPSQNARFYWDEIFNKSAVINIVERPVYFVSSNLHSLVNLTGGFVYHFQNEIFNFAEKQLPDLAADWEKIKTTNNILRVNDFLYYLSKKYFEANPAKLKEKKDYEYRLGFIQIEPRDYIEAEIQILPLKAVASSQFLDPFLQLTKTKKLTDSSAIIVNIEYPLGLTAYFALRELLGRLKNLRGIYLMGKAAILAGEIGDVQIPTVVYDERSDQTFEFNNIFNGNFPRTALQSKILNHQKAVSVYSTFLENLEQLKQYHQNGFNLIEMESGPYLRAIKEKFSDLNHLPFDFGIVNYASDNPLSQTLGEGPLNLRGIEPTYLAALAIVQRIIEQELNN